MPNTIVIDWNRPMGAPLVAFRVPPVPGDSIYNELVKLEELHGVRFSGLTRAYPLSTPNRYNGEAEAQIVSELEAARERALEGVLKEWYIG